MINFKHLPTEKEHILIPAIISILACLAFLFDRELSDALIYSRSALEQGQLWRLFTGHFFHSNLNHLLLNVGTLVILWLLHGHYYDNNSYLFIFTLAALTVSVAMYYFSPDIQQYVGLSGVLHSIFIWGTLLDIKHKEKTGYLLFIGAWLKIAHEQFVGVREDIVKLIEADVAIDAHLYGAITGLIVGLYLLKYPLKKTLN